MPRRKNCPLPFPDGDKVRAIQWRQPSDRPGQSRVAGPFALPDLRHSMAGRPVMNGVPDTSSRSSQLFSSSMSPRSSAASRNSALSLAASRREQPGASAVSGRAAVDCTISSRQWHDGEYARRMKALGTRRRRKVTADAGEQQDDNSVYPSTGGSNSIHSRNGRSLSGNGALRRRRALLQPATFVGPAPTVQSIHANSTSTVLV